MVAIVWTEIAMEDLRLIHEYISKDSVMSADKQIDKIINRVDQIAIFPRSGRVVPEFNSEIIRELIEGSYRIIYQINSDAIGIVRIHHTARQLK